ncbi:hypothetical protein VF06_22840 [Nostoc linckia z4]|nr:hypothetical protein VF02_14780 [Nostoc linckia z1]PHJ68494.1 hypothetical protein VF05_15470 [Nostoc linckia z3]PHJ80326.1 hypothetical protein VF06_22840 [Nostoc linckia z4]PHK04551.1 hypothetical protein VF09_28320 [Nostoc linckia z9]PHK38881.1 hypothetical protein VF12_16425 [Nostoc linckia z15]PHK44677.1 hypothetical protein VF13_20530 [Nostoc linckia z16]
MGIGRSLSLTPATIAYNLHRHTNGYISLAILLARLLGGDFAVGLLAGLDFELLILDSPQAKISDLGMYQLIFVQYFQVASELHMSCN